VGIDKSINEFYITGVHAVVMVLQEESWQLQNKISTDLNIECERQTTTHYYKSVCEDIWRSHKLVNVHHLGFQTPPKKAMFVPEECHQCWTTSNSVAAGNTGHSSHGDANSRLVCVRVRVCVCVLYIHYYRATRLTNELASSGATHRAAERSLVGE